MNHASQPSTCCQQIGGQGNTQVNIICPLACVAAAALFFSSSLMSAAEVVAPVMKRNALVVERAHDPLARENVRLEAAGVKTSAAGKVFRVEMSGNKVGQTVVELLFLVQNEGFPERILVAGQAITESPTDSFEFVIPSSYSSKALKGWWVRAVSHGQVIGVAASGPKFAEMASDPKTAVRYGER